MSSVMTDPLAEGRGLTEEVSRRIEDTVSEVGADVVLAEINRNCFIIYVTVRAWAGRYMMQNAEVQVDGHTVDEDLRTNGSWKLIPTAWHKAIQPFEGKARKAIRQAGVSFKDGVYIVPKTKAKALVDALKAIRVNYMAKVAEFQAEWPDIVEQKEREIVQKLGHAQWMAISKLLPDARQLGKLYDIEIGLWPVGGGESGLPVECFDDLQRAAHQLDAVDRLVAAMQVGMGGEDAELLASFARDVRGVWDKARRGAGKMIEENAEEWMAEAQATTNRMVAAAVEAMISDPVREFTEQVDKLAALSESRTVRAGTLEALRRAYAKLQGFSFMMPATLLDRLKQVELRIGGASPQSMNASSIAGQQLNAALRDIRVELDSDVNQLNAFGQFTRHLDI